MPLHRFEENLAVAFSRWNQRHGKMIRAVRVMALAHIAEGLVVPIIVAVNRQRSQPRAGRREGCRAVSIVQVHVEDGCLADFPFRAKRLQRHHKAVEGAEALAVIRTGVMESTRQGRRYTALQRTPRRRQHSAAGEADAWKKQLAPREFLRLREVSRIAGSHRIDILGRVDPQQILLGQRLWFFYNDLRQPGPHLASNERKLPHRHDVLANRCSKSGVIEKFHGCEQQCANSCIFIARYFHARHDDSLQAIPPTRPFLNPKTDF